MKTPRLLDKVDDSRYLAAMTSAIFKAGFVWQIIDHKWPGFEKAFWNFNVLRCAMMSPDDFDALCGDERIVRNPQKIRTVPLNATMMQKSHGTFGRFLATWPQDDFVGLLAFLDKNGSRLGGKSAQYFLRAVGVDGFVLSREGIAALIGAGVVDKPPCPGSRSQALALAAAAQARAGRVTVHVRIDERSAAVFALGLARETGTPAPVPARPASRTRTRWPDS